MGSKSKIEWLEGGSTWNVLYGCTKVSAGCRDCYAERVVPRLTGKIPPGASFQGGVVSVPEKLDEPRGWRRPRKVFVNSLSDTFHASVSVEVLDAMMETIAATPQHSYIMLTKRPRRMAEYLSRYGAARLPNLWAGTSAEDQPTLDERILPLSITPAAKRVLSLEPLIAPVSLPAARLKECGIGWVIVGGESGRNARPCEERWVRQVVRDCREAGVPVYVKQMGAAWAAKLGMCIGPNRLDTKGNQPYAWPKDLQVREVPRTEDRHDD